MCCMIAAPLFWNGCLRDFALGPLEGLAHHPPVGISGADILSRIVINVRASAFDKNTRLLQV